MKYEPKTITLKDKNDKWRMVFNWEDERQPPQDVMLKCLDMTGCYGNTPFQVTRHGPLPHHAYAGTGSMKATNEYFFPPNRRWRILTLDQAREIWYTLMDREWTVVP